MKNVLVYLAGPYRSKVGENGVYENIERAREAARRIWATMDVACICPHMNTAFFGGEDIPDDKFLEGDLVMLRRCDIVCMLPGWRDSAGSRGERTDAKMNGIPVAEGLDDLRTMLQTLEG